MVQVLVRTRTGRIEQPVVVLGRGAQYSTSDARGFYSRQRGSDGPELLRQWQLGGGRWRKFDTRVFRRDLKGNGLP